VAFSADGIHWGPAIACPEANSPGDTHNNAFWAPTLGRYVGITRTWSKSFRRQVSRTSSGDFLNWEETRLLFAVDNRSDETISAIGTGVRVQRGEVEFRAVFPTGHGVPPPRGRVEAGAVERGWFQFPPLDRLGPPLVIIWDGARPDSPIQRFRPWQWVADTAGGQQPEG
jgi:hypothetical protein